MDVRAGRIAALALAAFSLLCMGLMLAAMSGGRHEARTLFTWLASSAYVLAAVAGGAWGGAAGRWMLLGLAGCWLGDVWGPSNFLAGLYAFLAAHVAFSVAFLLGKPAWRRLAAAGAGAAALSIAALAWLLPKVAHDDRGSVIAYAAVISVMLASVFGRPRKGWAWLSVPGATLFYASDLILARWRYVSDAAYHAFLCYPMYYLACALLALSAGALAAEASSAKGNRGGSERVSTGRKGS